MITHSLSLIGERSSSDLIPGHPNLAGQYSIFLACKKRSIVHGMVQGENSNKSIELRLKTSKIEIKLLVGKTCRLKTSNFVSLLIKRKQ